MLRVTYDRVMYRRPAYETSLNARSHREDHGRDAAAAWLRALGLPSVPRWHVEASLQASAATRFHLNVYAEEWGFAFHHARRSSWIRVTDIAFVHGRDDFGLLAAAPDLLGVSALIDALEQTHAIAFRRSSIKVRSNIRGASRVVKDWLTRPIVELCGNEMHGDIRCTREKGHEGHHELRTREGLLRWTSGTLP